MSTDNDLSAFLEEQNGELEAIQALFVRPGEFEYVDDSSFRLHFLPNPDQNDSANNFVECSLWVKYTPKYPQILPEWDIVSKKGLDDNQIEEIKGKVNEEMEKLLGMPMIYDIAQVIQDWLVLNNRPPLSMHDEMLNRDKVPADSSAIKDYSNYYQNDDDDDSEDDSDFGSDNEETSDQRLSDRHLVSADKRATKEEFDVWAAAFRREMISKGIWKSSEADKKRASGRELFENDATLATRDDQDGDCGTFWQETEVFQENQELPDFGSDDNEYEKREI